MKKILIVDDEKDFCELIKFRIESSGDFQVVTYSNGKEAAKIARREKPDLILLDVIMPGIDGPGIAAELKNFKETRDIPIVFLTAIVNQDEAKERSNVIGGEYFLAKPVDSKELLNIINELIR